MTTISTISCCILALCLAIGLLSIQAHPVSNQNELSRRSSEDNETNALNDDLCYPLFDGDNATQFAGQITAFFRPSDMDDPDSVWEYDM